MKFTDLKLGDMIVNLQDSVGRLVLSVERFELRYYIKYLVMWRGDVWPRERKIYTSVYKGDEIVNQTAIIVVRGTA